MNKPSSCSLPSQKRCTCPLNIFVAFLWTHIKRSTSLLRWGAQACTQCFRCPQEGRTEGTITSLALLPLCCCRLGTTGLWGCRNTLVAHVAFHPLGHLSHSQGLQGGLQEVLQDYHSSWGEAGILTYEEREWIKFVPFTFTALSEFLYKHEAQLCLQCFMANIMSDTVSVLSDHAWTIQTSPGWGRRAGGGNNLQDTFILIPVGLWLQISIDTIILSDGNTFCNCTYHLPMEESKYSGLCPYSLECKSNDNDHFLFICCMLGYVWSGLCNG